MPLQPVAIPETLGPAESVGGSSGYNKVFLLHIAFLAFRGSGVTISGIRLTRSLAPDRIVALGFR